MPAAHQKPIELVLQHRISPERLAPYIRETPTLHEAIRLYRWNIDLSGAVYEALHVFEVVLRNAMDEQLCRWNASQTNPDTGRLHSSDWLIEPSALLLRVAGRDIPDARRRALKSTTRRPHGQREPLHEDILAAMSLGTWRFILPGRHDAGKQRLWDEAVHKAFPHLRRAPRELERAVEGVYQLRNRVAHLEPIINSNVRAQLTNMRTVIGAIDPQLLSWFTSTERISSTLTLRPSPAPKAP
ncbi:hypothetical protein [Pseudarthrobacter oxydans]|uniref:hypothetical protein n=1 Tax=Pseudarthrobacter oxydans TaxID=1671 RepID=UPI002AA61285|nr:hypothetical protein [Pseudarthrobacter oxydans]WPU11035.1 hypothetical protein SMD14_08660 [Pseudarthrobacter oxydans]